MKNLVVAITTITSTLSGETVHPEPPVHYICFFVDGTENRSGLSGTRHTLFTTLEEAVHPDPLFFVTFLSFSTPTLIFSRYADLQKVYVLYSSSVGDCGGIFCRNLLDVPSLAISFHTRYFLFLALDQASSLHMGRRTLLRIALPRIQM